MGFRNGAYASVFGVEPKSNTWTKGQISISKKNKDTGLYENTFSGYVDFVGTASAAKAAGLKVEQHNPAKIRLKDVDLENHYDKEKKIMYWNPKVWSFETQEEYEQSSGLGTGGSYGYNSPPSMDDMLKVAEEGTFEDPVDDEALPW